MMMVASSCLENVCIHGGECKLEFTLNGGTCFQCIALMIWSGILFFQRRRNVEFVCAGGVGGCSRRAGRRLVLPRARVDLRPCHVDGGHRRVCSPKHTLSHPARLSLCHHQNVTHGGWMGCYSRFGREREGGGWGVYVYASQSTQD